MFFNSVQNFDSWKTYFGHPEGSMLGLLGALYQIGSLVSIPFVPMMADNIGRKIPIAIGCVIMVVGSVLQGSCQNLGSTYFANLLLDTASSHSEVPSTDNTHSIHGRPCPARFRKQSRSDCFSHAPHRVVPPSASWTFYYRL